MGKRENFTAERVACCKCEPGKQQSIYWDGKTPGLGLRVTASGAKSYIFETRLHGKTIRLTIGSPDAWPLETQWRTDRATGERVEFQRGARQEAARLKTLTDQGNDPRLLAAEQRAKVEAAQAEAKRRDANAYVAWQEYIKARKGRWSEKHLADHEEVSKEGGLPRKRGRRPGESETTLPGILRPLLLLPLQQIDADRVRAWLKSEAERRPTRARLAYGLLRTFLNWCADHKEYRGMVCADACAPRIAKGELPKKQAKDDCLQREQLSAWFEKVGAISNPVISAYLQTALLTGARREEVAQIKWTDVDFQWRTIRIRDKVEGERVIPLTPYVASLLLNLKRINDMPPPRHRILNGKIIENDLENWKPSLWVFSSKTSKSGRLQEPRMRHASACLAAGIPGLTIHGLRRSFGTLSEWVECPAGIVAQIQGHKPSATAEKHYRRRPIDLLRMWHVKIEVWILEQAGIKQPKEEAAKIQNVKGKATA